MTTWYKNHRPLLTVERTGSKEFGRCYSASYYKVTSQNRLSTKQLHSLADSGVIYSGQEFYVRSTCNGQEEAAGFDSVPPSDDNGNVVAGDPLKCPYYVYSLETRVDSGD